MMAETVLFDQGFLTRCVLALGHFLWQGAAIAGVVLLLSIVLRRSGPQLRYSLLVAAMVLMACCPVATFWNVSLPETDTGPRPTVATDRFEGGFASLSGRKLDINQGGTTTVSWTAGDELQIDRLSSQTPLLEVSATANTRTSDGSTRPVANDLRGFERWVPYFAISYMLGVLVLVGRLLLGLHGSRRLRSRAVAVDDQDLLSAIARRADTLRMRAIPAVFYCKHVAVPTVVGLFRPVILLPLSLTTGLSPEQVEAVLTHEMAHIRRYDHLVNLLQRIIESVLFFHPAVWWVSHRIRVERENCCDDIVVQLGTQRLEYAASLLTIAERGMSTRARRRFASAVELNATGGGSALARRVRRLVDGSIGEPLRLVHDGLAGVCFAICLAAAVFQVAAVTTIIHTDRSVAATKDSNPRQVVSEWMKMVLAGNIRDSWKFTTESRHLNAQHDLPRLKKRADVRIQRSLGNDAVVAVVTNVIQDNFKRERAFVFWLVNRSGDWRINRSHLDDPSNIDQQLRGFLAAGNVRWHVSVSDLIGTWETGPGAPFGTGGLACGSRIQFGEKGRFTLQTWDPAGEMTQKAGTWRLRGDRILRNQDQKGMISRVIWLADGKLTLEGTEGRPRSADYDRVSAAELREEEKDEHATEKGSRKSRLSSEAEVAWGEPVDGLQAGLVAVGNTGGYRIGDNVPLKFLLRNRSDKTLTLRHPRVPVFINWNNYRKPIGPQLFDPQGKQVFPARGVGGVGLPGRQTRTIAGGETVTLATPFIPIRHSAWEGQTINALTYPVEPGRHRVALSYRFGGDDLWQGEVATGELQFDVLPASGQSSTLPARLGPWGKENNGVFCRLRVDKPLCSIGETPILLVDLKNQGTETVKQIWHGLEFKLEVDGTWIGRFSPTIVSGPEIQLAPGDEWINVPLVLRENFYNLTSTSSVKSGMADFSKILGMGKHRIRIAIDGVESNILEIEVVARKEGENAVIRSAVPGNARDRAASVEGSGEPPSTPLLELFFGTIEGTQEDDPLKRILKIDAQQVARQAGKTQQDTALTLRVLRVAGLTETEQADLRNLARHDRLGPLNFRVVEKVESLPKSSPANPPPDQFIKRIGAMLEFSEAELEGFKNVYQRTGQRTLALLTLDDSLSETELAAAKKFKAFATAFYVNHETIAALAKNNKLNARETSAVQKLAALIERHFQRMFFVFFSC